MVVRLLGPLLMGLIVGLIGQYLKIMNSNLKVLPKFNNLVIPLHINNKIMEERAISLKILQISTHNSKILANNRRSQSLFLISKLQLINLISMIHFQNWFKSNSYLQEVPRSSNKNNQWTSNSYNRSGEWCRDSFTKCNNSQVHLTTTKFKFLCYKIKCSNLCTWCKIL